jgi:hypothetical protein
MVLPDPSELIGVTMILLLFSLFISEMHPAFGCLALAGAVGLGATQRPLWVALPVTFGGAAANLAFLLSRWKISAGLWDSGVSAAGHLLVVFGVICGGGWVLGRCGAWLVRAAILCVSWLVRCALSAQS